MNKKTTVNEIAAKVDRAVYLTLTEAGWTDHDIKTFCAGIAEVTIDAGCTDDDQILEIAFDSLTERV